MKVNVTWDDIDFGKPGSAYNCAIAKALKRQLNINRATVNYDSITVLGQVIPTPKSAETFMTKFDTNKLVRPFSFDLNVSVPVQARLITVGATEPCEVF